MITIGVSEVPVSPNGNNGLLRMHWTRRRKYFQKWQHLIRAEITYSPEKPEKKKQRVHILQFRKQLLDKDNLYSSCKPLLDAACNLNLLYGDSTEWIDLEVNQQISRTQWTIITIMDISKEQPNA